MNPYVILGALLALAAAGAGGFRLGYDVRDDAAEKAEVQAQRIAAQVRTANAAFAHDVARSTTTAIAGIRIENTVINQEIRHERETFTRVLENPDCAIPLSTVQLLNAARGYGALRPAGPEPDPGLPAAGAPVGSQAAPRRRPGPGR